jgi:hypothetical protein
MIRKRTGKVTAQNEFPGGIFLVLDFVQYA